jgi:isocitrate dehydrogenase
LGMTLDQAIGDLLDNRKSPSRKCGELDNRGSHFYLAMYWAQTLAKQNEDPILKERFSQPAAELAAAEKQIIEELNSVQGSPADIGGYYRPDKVKADAVMRPSKTFNRIVEGI